MALSIVYLNFADKMSIIFLIRSKKNEHEIYSMNIKSIPNSQCQYGKWNSEKHDNKLLKITCNDMRDRSLHKCLYNICRRTVLNPVVH